MKKLDIEHLIKLQRNHQQLRDVANDLANQLIIEYDINAGYQMANFLKVPNGLDNYTAIRTWAEQWLQQHYPLTDDNANYTDLKHDDALYTQIKHQFLTHFPATCVA